MPRSKEISDDLRKRVVNAHLSGDGCKNISKRWSLHPSTVRQIVYKWKQHHKTVTLPRSGRPAKMTPKVTRKVIREVKKNPRLTSQNIKASLASDGIHADASTVRNTLAKNGLHGRVGRKKHSSHLRTFQ